MRTFAEFQIMGRVGKIVELGTTLRVSLAADYGRKDENGSFTSRAFWNTVTIFNDQTIAWAKENLSVGDLVFARGTVRDSNWTEGDKRHFATTFAADEFSRLTTSGSKDE